MVVILMIIYKNKIIFERKNEIIFKLPSINIDNSF